MNFPCVNGSACYIKGQKHDKSLSSVLNNYLQSMIAPKEKAGALEKVQYEDPNYIYPEPIRCLHCKVRNSNGEEVGKKTTNLPGVICCRSVSRRGASYNIKAKCEKCHTSKNSFVKRESLPEYILNKLEAGI
ncbi:hypothetical protein DLEV_166 [Diachasmimorpha longicaudata entomopoxvirus]|uniref:Uncharacterized protein n=1 Tax=Diachasmimorpha longicaudata entomopoxvirus TaxID=109981 RepID=A0A7R5WUG1_9POXV|nr:hypothetical protein QKK69_gp166 [Diachasmimorpha longicaudata entomopoxvirus]AKS26457.1 hypothetical protein DLEV_166 [Diachasmimorpha longicaudata entomopoxvirus]